MLLVRCLGLELCVLKQNNTFFLFFFFFLLILNEISVKCIFDQFSSNNKIEEVILFKLTFVSVCIFLENL